MLAGAAHDPAGELVAEIDDAYEVLVAAAEPVTVGVEDDIVISATG